jgi:hypothetical protein
MVSTTDPHGRNLYFLDWSRCFFFQVAPQLYSRDWVDLVPDPLVTKRQHATARRSNVFNSVCSRQWTRSKETARHYQMPQRIWLNESVVGNGLVAKRQHATAQCSNVFNSVCSRQWTRCKETALHCPVSQRIWLSKSVATNGPAAKRQHATAQCRNVFDSVSL